MSSPIKANPSEYLGECEIIDFRSTEVSDVARSLGEGDALVTAQRCFEFVRDEIQHSSDYQRNPVTCRASEALKYRTGYCYSKSHLLCALLRANNLPAGLCYQRLSISGDSAPYSLHGLNAVYLEDFGWYRIDARGNREDIDARFSPPNECLAFETLDPNEHDLPGIYATPLPEVVDCLRKYSTWDSVLENLPDSIDF